MEAGEYGLTRGTCFVAGHLEVVAIAGLLWISWCVLVAARFVSVFFSSFFFFFKHTRSAVSMRPPCLIYLATSNEARPRERSDRGLFFSIRQKMLFIMRPSFAYRQKSLFIQGCVQGPLFERSEFLIDTRYIPKKICLCV